MVTKESGSLKKYSGEPWKLEDQAKLAIVLGQVFDSQKQYGKTTSQLENIVKLFCWVLAEYPVEKVIKGISMYMRDHTDMPAPADIVKIIDPKPQEFKPNAAYYVRLQKIFTERGPYGLDSDEVEYIRKYEAHMQREMRERT